MTCGLNLKRVTVSNKHNFVNYHVVHRTIPTGILCVAKEDTETYLAEVFVGLVHQETETA